MADTNKNFLDLEGLQYYDGKIQTQIAGKADAVAGKQLSTEDFTTAEKDKLAALKDYTLPAATETALGGVMIPTNEDPVPTKTALKVSATGKAYVDWTEAPMASSTTPGLMKLGSDFVVNEDGSVSIDPDKAGISEVSWSDIKDKPDVALKTDVSGVYQYAGSVATASNLPAAETEGLKVGDVYNVEDTDMNYAWTGTEWDPLGGSFTISRITNEQIDALFETGD